MNILKKFLLGCAMLFCGLFALLGIALVLDTITDWETYGTTVLVVGIAMTALFGWLLWKSYIAFHRPPIYKCTAKPKRYLNEKTKFQIKLTVSLAATVGGLIMVASGNDDLVEAGAPLTLFGLTFAFGFSRSHKKWVKQESEARERNQAQAALEANIARVSAMTALSVVNPVSVILRPGEICHYQESASVLQVKNEVVGHTSGSTGVSVRVAKGLTLHSGGSRGHAIRQAVSHLHPGLFTITNQRFIMTGEKGFDHPLSKLTAMTPYNGYEGITLQFGRSVYTVIMDESYIVPKIWDLINQPVSSGEKTNPQHLNLPEEAVHAADPVEIHAERVDTEAEVPTPRGAELSYLDAEALRFWSKKSSDFQVPAYYSESTFGRNVEPARERLLKGGYLSFGDDRQRIALKKVPELKAILADRELKVSGNKKELVQRILDNFDEDEIEELFPVRPYMLTEKGEQALVPYEIIRESEAHGLDFSHYRLMGEKDAHPDDEDHIILARLLSEDIQECYRNQDRSSFQRIIMKVARFMREIDEPELALESYSLAFLVWTQEAAEYNIPQTNTQTYFMAKNLEEVGEICGYTFDKLVEEFKAAVKKSNPFALATDKNIDNAVLLLKSSLGVSKV